MKKHKQKKYKWVIITFICLTCADTFVLLKAFYLPEVKATVKQTESSNQTTQNVNTTSEPTITDTSYTDDNLQITIDKNYTDNTNVYVVDIQVSDPSFLKTALANDSYGRNITETTSQMAKNNQAILAINGDFYGFRSTGYVIRNGTLYRDTTSDSPQEDLVIDNEGNFSIINESDTTAQELLDNGAQQVLSFGPSLVVNGELAVSENTEVGQSMSSNPRTAIGQIDTNHYVIIVSEGRTDDSKGLSLYQLAEQFKSVGATTAYNLDGGGSSTLYFNGKVINQTVGGAKGSNERSVSDIIYIR
ncbi:phosphodiester glycosidase family protein [Vagococcus sp. JNUCC 83]